MKLIDDIALSAIRVYRKYVSPWKGFSCAYAQAHHQGSCSQRVYAIILHHGVIRGLGRIRQQFRDCGQAADLLNGSQRADLDCSLGGCLDVGGPGGCFGGFGSGRAGGAADCGVVIVDCLSPFGGRNRRRNSWLLFILLALGLAAGYFAYGSQVTGMEIRLIGAANEDRDRKWGLVNNSELPDYQVIAYVGQQRLESSIAHNQSAEGWVKVLFDRKFKLGAMQTFQIANRQLLTRKVLEEISSPPAAGRGTKYQYRVVRAWSFR